MAALLVVSIDQVAAVELCAALVQVLRIERMEKLELLAATHHRVQVLVLVEVDGPACPAAPEP